MTGCRAQGNARSGGSAGENRRSQIKLANQPGENIGVEIGFRITPEGEIGCAAIWPIPDQRPQTACGKRLSQLAHTGVVLGEASAWSDRDRPAGADELVVYPDTVDFRARHPDLLASSPCCDRQRKPTGRPSSAPCELPPFLRAYPEPATPRGP